MIMHALFQAGTKESMKAHTPSQARSIRRPVGRSTKRPQEPDAVNQNFDVSAGTKSISDL